MSNARTAAHAAGEPIRRDLHGVVMQATWVVAAAVVGFALSGVFSRALRLQRDVFLVPYVLGVAAFLSSYRHANGVDVIRAVRERWPAGLVGAAVAGAFVVFSVLRQAASPRPPNVALHIAWLGLAYGAADALLLSVLPVAATWRAMAALRRAENGIAAGLLALAASLLVCAAYHLGYAEYRGAGIAGPLIGVGVMTVAHVVTRNPLAPLLSHIAMHVAAVLHGIDSTVQLPPHS